VPSAAPARARKQTKQQAESAPAPGFAKERFSNTTREGRIVVLCLILALATVGFYNPVVHNGFTNFDDDYYIFHNPHVTGGLSWDTVQWAFTSYYATNWHPLTWLSHALDCQLFKLNPAGHHYETVLLHAANAILLFLLLEAATGLMWPSLIVAALFALHPVNVESVAWAAERKNVLSMLFFLLTLHAYRWYVRQTSVGRYAVVAALFAVGLMAKPEIITLPFVLLLWDYWPLRRMFTGEVSGVEPKKDGTFVHEGTSFARLFLEKVPLLALSAISAVITFRAQAAGDAMPTMDARWKIGNAIVAYSRYLGLAVWPTKLSVLYIHPGQFLPTWQVLASAALLIALTVVVLRLQDRHKQDRHKKDRRYLAVGWFWFLGTLVPVIGLVQVGQQAMADRYAYLSFIGLFIAVIWAIADGVERWAINGAWLAVPAVLVLAVFGTLTYNQLAYWHDSETLWRHELNLNENNYVAHDNLARALVNQGRTEEAIGEFKAADGLGWYTPPEMIEVGLYEQSHGDLKDAIDEYQRSLAHSQDSKSRSLAFSVLASAFLQAGDIDQAVKSYNGALQENPDNSTALVGSALLAERNGNLVPAVDQLSHAMRIEPSDVGYLLLGQALRRDGRAADADAAESHAQRISHDLLQAQRTATQILASAGIHSN
jgi:protein O-mannosyl-transferase